VQSVVFFISAPYSSPALLPCIRIHTLFFCRCIGYDINHFPFLFLALLERNAYNAISTRKHHFVPAAAEPGAGSIGKIGNDVSLALEVIFRYL
jgi:hypothetical protein